MTESTRQSWLAHYHGVNLGADTVPAPFQEPLTVTAEHSDVAERALRTAAVGRGSLHDVRTMHPSPNWNDLAGGHELSVPIDQDPHALQALADRAERVRGRSEAVQEIYPMVLELLKSGVEQGIREEYVPPVMRDRLRDAFASTAVRVVDPVVLDNVVGEYWPGNNYAQISAALEDEDELAITIAHEVFGHGGSGGTFSTDKAGNPSRDRIGFHETTRTGEPRHRGLDEIVEHHLTLSYLYGDFAVLDPDQRPDSNTGYYHHRKLLSELIKRSDGLIDLRVITRAACEDTDEKSVAVADRMEMARQGRDAYGAGAYSKFDVLSEELYRILSTDISQSELDEQFQGLIDRIHPASKDASGNTVRGHIDISGLQGR